MIKSAANVYDHKIIFSAYLERLPAGIWLQNPNFISPAQKTEMHIKTVCTPYADPKTKST